MPRLALIRQQYRPDGGAERFVSRALEALSHSGIELSLITRHWQQQGPFRVLTCNPPIWGRISRERNFAEAAMKRCAEENFDLVQSHERIPGCSVYRAGDGVHRQWLNIRREFLPHWKSWWQEHSRYHQYVLQAESAMFQHPALKAIICNSEMVRSEIIRHFQIPGENIHVIYNGIDSSQFHPRQKIQSSIMREQLGIPQAARLFLFVGSGFERKNLSTVLQAMQPLGMEAHLAIIGRDSHSERYQRQARKLGIEARCHFLGIRHDLPALYGMADALVLPTYYDPFPNVILEAMASGLPIITSTQCGGAELVANGAGFVCSPADHATLTGFMQQLCDPELADTLGLEARHRIEPLSLEAMSQQLLQLYGMLLDIPSQNPTLPESG